GRQERRRALGHAVRAELRDLRLEGARRDGARGTEYADVPRAHRDRRFRRGDADAEDPTRRTRAGIAQLQMAQSHARDGVARDDDEAASLFEEALDALLGQIQEDMRVAPTVRRAPRVAEVHEIALGKDRAQLPQDRQPAETRVVDADHADTSGRLSS